MRRLVIILAIVFALFNTLTFTGCTFNIYNVVPVNPYELDRNQELGYIAKDGKWYPYHQLPADITQSDVPTRLGK